jgi:hypothetical protein
MASCVFVAISLPVVWRGAPLADDFNNCVAPVERGLDGFIAASWHQLGAVRPARFLEILLAAGVCGNVPFGVAILVCMLLTLAVAVLVRAVLRDLGTPPLWAGIGGALWLLQPLGTEAALWPAALHVPLGLCLALAAVRWYRRGRLGWAAAANVGAALSVEQVILALPVVAWMVAPPGARRRAAVSSAAIAVCVIATFLLWPGDNPRLRAGVAERFAALASNPAFYVGYPAVGLGLHSIPLAIGWALPWSLGIVGLGAFAGWRFGSSFSDAVRSVSRVARLQGAAAIAAVIVLLNVPVVLAIPQQGSPRVFAPTWLVLVIAAALGGASVRWARPRLLGAIGGMCAAGALLSLAFSVSVRLRTADFTEHAADVVAARIQDGDRVALCGVRRTVVASAPRGAFAVHDFIYEWSAERALAYYTGRRATIVLSGELWDRACPPVSDVDRVIQFDELMAGVPR